MWSYLQKFSSYFYSGEQQVEKTCDSKISEKIEIEKDIQMDEQPKKVTLLPAIPDPYMINRHTVPISLFEVHNRTSLFNKNTKCESCGCSCNCNK